MAGKPRQWRRPDRKRLRTIRDRLREYYGKPRNEPHHAPLDELVLTILSQNTNDRNRDVAYARLRSRFTGWAEVAAAPVAELEEAIRPGGISKVKSKRIQQILHVISVERGSLDLDFLERAPREQALEFLESLPGVGRKTAACVLLFSYDRPELPVDTHVYRVASRLGLIRPKASFEEAHRELLGLVGVSHPEDVYELHVNTLRHGRRLCRPQRPLCQQCPLLSLCPYGRGQVRRLNEASRGRRKADPNAR
jgi:endonuclease-3